MRRIFFDQCQWPRIMPKTVKIDRELLGKLIEGFESYAREHCTDNNIAVPIEDREILEQAKTLLDNARN